MTAGNYDKPTNAIRPVPPPRGMTAADYDRARRLLSRRDPVLKAIIEAYGPCGLANGQRDHGLQAVIESIVWQQLSGKAAATIFRRFLASFPSGGFPTADQILAVTPESLRQAGLSFPKVAYIRDVCQRVVSGALDFDRLETMTDQEVIDTLTQIKGIGRWSAEMFLMFRLHRPDVLPVGDLGIVKAIQRAYRLRKPPTPKKMLKLGERWQPYRSVASWYLWASLENTPLQKQTREV
jgi:DNA-3-methyladenine glycosylase II